MSYKRTKLDPMDYFNKVYEFKSESTVWELPERSFDKEQWYLRRLQKRKRQLNAVKEKLHGIDLKRWSLHTKERDPSTNIIKTIREKFDPELLTQAWCKFYECLSKHDLIPSEAIESSKLRSFHICEAPGGFVSALNHFLAVNHPEVKLDWRACTLNPDYEQNHLSSMIPDERLMVNTKSHWLLGADNTGDILPFYNYQAITNEILKTGKVLLVTADGSVDCMECPGEQERYLEDLHFCEAVTALTVLAEGGSFVLKIFTTFEDTTISLLYLLACCFNQLKIFKPITSKSGNSETYIICKDYKPPENLAKIWPSFLEVYKAPGTKPMFRLCDIPEDFLLQVLECVDFFKQMQIYTISENIKFFLLRRRGENKRIKNLHREIAYCFLECYKLQEILSSRRLVNVIEESVCPDDHLHSTDKSCKNVGKKEMKLDFVLGKRISNVYFTKLCPQEVLEKLLFDNRKFDGSSLFEKTKQVLSQRFVIFDISDFNYINFSQFQRELFFKIYENLNDCKGFLFINVPFITNVIASILYLVSKSFKSISYCRSGIIYTKDFVRDEKVSGFFEEVKAKYLEVESIQTDFEIDIIQIIKDVNIRMKRLWAYNSKLPTRKPPIELIKWF